MNYKIDLLLMIFVSKGQFDLFVSPFIGNTERITNENNRIDKE